MIDVNVGGVGSFDVEDFRLGTGRLEFGGSVGSGQTVGLGAGGMLYPGSANSVQIDRPGKFFGHVDMGSVGEIDLTVWPGPTATVTRTTCCRFSLWGGCLTGCR